MTGMNYGMLFKGLLLFVGLILAPAPADDHTEPIYYPPKEYRAALHILIASGICIGNYYLMPDEVPKKYRLIFSGGAGVLAGFYKELMDSQRINYFDYKDMMEYFMGGMAGMTVILILEF